MRLLILRIAIFIALGFHVEAQIPVDAAQAAILQHKLDSCVTAFNVPGISATILLPGDRYWNGAAGLNDIYSLDPMDTTHLFYQASVTKMFVAAIVFQMIEQNLLSLDDSIGRYLPPILTIPPSTRIRYLLNHRSGLDNFLGSNPASTSTWFTHPDSIWIPQNAIEAYNGNPLFNQGNAFAYSNTNYIVLGMLIEQITGNTFATELNNRILIPYGLTQTFFPPADSIAGNQVTGWTSFISFSGPYDTDASPILNNCSASMFFTAGALVSCPKDVAAFTRTLFSGDFVHDTTLTLMKTCTNVNLGEGCNGYGYGTMRYNFAGKTYFGHAGDLSGFTQLTIHHEADEVTLAISINRNHAPRGAIALAMLAALQEAITVGVDGSVTNPFSFSFYPNPAVNALTVSFANATIDRYQIEIINASGQQEYSEALKSPVDQHTINLQGLPGGIYFLKASSGSRIEIQKLIIQK